MVKTDDTVEVAVHSANGKPSLHMNHSETLVTGNMDDAANEDSKTKEKWCKY